MDWILPVHQFSTDFGGVIESVHKSHHEDHEDLDTLTTIVCSSLNQLWPGGIPMFAIQSQLQGTVAVSIGQLQLVHLGSKVNKRPIYYSYYRHDSGYPKWDLFQSIFKLILGKNWHPLQPDIPIHFYRRQPALGQPDTALQLLEHELGQLSCDLAAIHWSLDGKMKSYWFHSCWPTPKSRARLWATILAVLPCNILQFHMEPHGTLWNPKNGRLHSRSSSVSAVMSHLREASLRRPMQGIAALVVQHQQGTFRWPAANNPIQQEKSSDSSRIFGIPTDLLGNLQGIHPRFLGSLYTDLLENLLENLLIFRHLPRFSGFIPYYLSTLGPMDESRISSFMSSIMSAVFEESARYRSFLSQPWKARCFRVGCWWGFPWLCVKHHIHMGLSENVGLIFPMK